MSTPTLLSSILKDAPAVTSLATTDRILSVDANGNPQRISRLQVATPRLTATLSSPQWVRVASFSDSASALISISSHWNNNAGIRLLVEMILHPNSPNYNNIAVLSRLSHYSTSVITKLRTVTKAASLCYLDIWYQASARNSFAAHLLDTYNLNFLSDMELDAQIPDGYTAKEFSLTQAVWGGGKPLFHNDLQFYKERRCA